MKTNIYFYTDLLEYLSAIYAEKKTNNSNFSLRAWSKHLGFSSPNMLSMILRGERKVLPKVADKMAESFKLSEEEKRYFNVLVLVHRAKNEEEKQLYLELLESENPNGNFTDLQLDKFKIISDWYHFALYEILGLQSAVTDIDWLYYKLKEDVPRSEIRKALERLERVGLIRFENGKFIQCSTEVISTSDDIPNSALKNFHNQMISKAQAALLGQGVDERHISGNTLAIDSSKLEELKNLIKKFEYQLAKLAQSEKADHVYQFNIQFFQLA